MTASIDQNHTSPSAPNTHHHHAKEEEKEEVDLGVPEPPDGGWGWVVVFCSFMIHVIADGVTYTFGIFHMEFLRYYGESNGVTAWVASIMVGTTFCIGPFASGFINQFGCRTVSITGSLLASFGLIISTFAPNIVFLYFSIGLCTGMGFGLMYLPAIVCVTCYFEKKRAFATGVAVCGSGIGTFLLAPITEWLVTLYGWKGAMLINAGFVLNCCVCGALFRPLKPELVPRQTITPVVTNFLANDKPRNRSLHSGSPTNNEANLSQPNLTKHSTSLLGISNDSYVMPSFDVCKETFTTLPCESASHCKHPTCRRSTVPFSKRFYSGSFCKLPAKVFPNLYPSQTIEEDPQLTVFQRILNYACPPAMQNAFKEVINFRLMKDPIFLIVMSSSFLMSIGLSVPYTYTKDRAVGLAIADDVSASYLLCIMGISNTVGRVIVGWLADRSCINRLWLYYACHIVCGLATAFSTFCLNYKMMAFYVAIFGATAGAYICLIPVILVDLFGVDKLTNAFGLLLLSVGMATFIGLPITGWLYDWTGSYDSGFYLSGGMISFGGIVLFLIPCVKKDQQIKSLQID